MQHLAQQGFAAVHIQRFGTGLLAPFLPVAVGEQGQVGIVRRGQVQAALQVNLARRGNQQILPAHDVGDALFAVVHHHGKLVGPKAIGAQQHEIADVLRQILPVSAHNPVVEGNGFIRHAHPPCGAVGKRRKCRLLFTGARSAVHKPVRAQTCGRVPIFAAAGAGIGQSARHQVVQCGAIQRVAAALVHHFTVPFEAELLQCVQDVAGRSGHFARRV